MRCGLSDRDLEESLADLGFDVDQLTLCRWVQGSTPESVDAGGYDGAAPVADAGHPPTGDCWFSQSWSSSPPKVETHVMMPAICRRAAC